MTIEIGMNFPEPFGLVDMFMAGMDREIVSDDQEWDDFDGRVALNLGAGKKHIVGTVGLDWPKWDANGLIPYEDGTVDRIYAFHLLEHLADPRPLLRECQRVLRSGGTMNIVVPYYKSNLAFHDFDHKSFYTEDSWENCFSTPYYDKDRDGWQFSIGYNVIMGVAERNLALITQLIRK